MFAALLIWTVLLWLLGLLIGHMAGQHEILNSIDAQLIELPSKQSSIQGEAERIPLQPSKPQPPRSAPQQVTPSPSKEQPNAAPTDQQPEPASAARPAPETSAPGAKDSFATVPSDVRNDADGSSQQGTLSSTPPQFGAAYLNNPKPVYPQLAKQMRMEGTVMLKVLVSRDGNARSVEIAHSSGYEMLDRAAAAAVKDWRFIPARRGDTPIDEWVQIPIAFHLKRMD